MKKLLIAVCLLIVTAAAEEKAASKYSIQKQPIDAVKAIDTLAGKMELLNKIQHHEK